MKVERRREMHWFYTYMRMKVARLDEVVAAVGFDCMEGRVSHSGLGVECAEERGFYRREW